MKILDKTRHIIPGLTVCVLIAALSQFMSQFIPVSAILICVLLGFAMHSICAKRNDLTPGVSFSADPVLKFGIVCLGARINLAVIAELGWRTFLIVIISMLVTTIAGVFLSKKLGVRRGLAILVAGAVSVCGSAAALALCSILPNDKKHHSDLVIAIVGVTILSTVCMVVYPLALLALGLNETDIGIVLGTSLHNVAQSVASGFSVSDTVGDTTTIVKLTRVSLLAPYIFLISSIVGWRWAKKKSCNLTSIRHRFFNSYSPKFLRNLASLIDIWVNLPIKVLPSSFGGRYRNSDLIRPIERN